MAKGRMLNYHSNHSYSIKINTAKGFLRRIFGLSDLKFWPKNVTLVIEILTKNEFPYRLILSLIRSAQASLTPTTNQNMNKTLYLSCVDESIDLSSTTFTHSDVFSYKSITYTKDLSVKLRNIIQPYLRHLKDLE